MPVGKLFAGENDMEPKPFLRLLPCCERNSHIAKIIVELSFHLVGVKKSFHLVTGVIKLNLKACLLFFITTGYKVNT